MTTTWTIAIDWNRNGSYTDTNDDVTSFVISANWTLGMQQAYQDCADNSVLKLVLNNSDKRFSPENGSSPLAGNLLPFRPVRIQSNDGTTIRTHWVGWIDSIQPSVGMYKERLVTIVASGPLQLLKATETQLGLQQNQSTDQIIAQLIKEVVFPPALSKAWVLERVGNSELDQTTVLADITLYSNLDTGNLVLAVAADNWVNDGGPSNIPKNTFDVSQAIQDITGAEHGKFLFDRTGLALFWNRYHLLQGENSVATFSDTMHDLTYTFAGIDQIKNEIIVVCHPRTVSTSTTDVLWQLPSNTVIRVEPGQTRTVYIKYEDATSAKRIGANNVSVTNLAFDPSIGGTATASVTPDANGANLTFVNSGTTPAVVTQCTVQGSKITDLGEMEVRSFDETSIVNFGRRTLRINLPSIDNINDAQYIADFERIRRSQAIGMVTSITLLSSGQQPSTLQAQQLARTLGDHITITETQTGHTADYYIIGEAHELTNSTLLWKTTWFLEPV